MNWYARNNAFGGIEMVLAQKPPAGYLAITLAQHKTLLAAPHGTTIDAEGNPVPAPPLSSEVQALIAYRKSRGAKG